MRADGLFEKADLGKVTISSTIAGPGGTGVFNSLLLSQDELVGVKSTFSSKAKQWKHTGPK